MVSIREHSAYTVPSTGGMIPSLACSRLCLSVPYSCKHGKAWCDKVLIERGTEKVGR